MNLATVRMAAVLLLALPGGSGAHASAGQADGGAYAPRTGWPMLPIPDIRPQDGGSRADIDSIIEAFERACLDSRFDRGRIARDEDLDYGPGTLRRPGGERGTLHVWRSGNRAVQLASIDDQGMGSQCTLTVATARAFDVKRLHARMTDRFGRRRNDRDDQAVFRAADGRFSPDWIAYRSHWLGDGEARRPRVVLFAVTYDGTGALARSSGVHLTAAELTE